MPFPQVVHAPVFPQAPFPSPTLHVPVLLPAGIEQQPPLQACDPLQAAPQRWVVVLHAAPAAPKVAAGQSVVTLQPQTPATQA